MTRFVKHVQLHAVPFVHGCGQLKATLSAHEYTGMVMVLTDTGVVVDYKNISFLVPLGNIIAMTFVDSKVANAEGSVLLQKPYLVANES